MRILLVEDDKQLAVTTVNNLKAHGLIADYALTGDEALEKLAAEIHDCIVIDLNLPDMSGYELLNAVHSKYPGIPAMALTAQAEEEARIRGIESGFDDYMTKPFQNVELAARLGVLIRRRDLPTAKVITLGKLQIEPAQMSVKYKNQDIKLTKTEFRILEVIARAYPAPVAKNKLLTTVWDRNDNGNYDKLLMAVSRLRKKLDSTNPDLVKVENGGYKLNL